LCSNLDAGVAALGVDVSDHAPAEPVESGSGKVLALARWLPYLVSAGCVLDVLSTFFPWGHDFGQDLFLPFSIPFPSGSSVRFIDGVPLILFVSVGTRLAAVVGFVALLLYGYFENILPTLVLLVSIGLSFGSFVVFSQLGWSLGLGAYIVLFAGFLKLFGLILKNVHLEIAAESGPL
jgi:hypothetical protein